MAAAEGTNGGVRIGPRISADEFLALATEGVPYVGQLGLRLEHFEHGRLTLRLPFQEILLRPGGTICGPALMGLADVALYGVVLSMIGRVELAVTTNMNVHFLSRPHPGDVFADGRIIKLGKRLAVGEVVLTQDGGEHPVCQVTGTYAIPPERGAAPDVAPTP